MSSALRINIHLFDNERGFLCYIKGLRGTTLHQLPKPDLIITPTFLRIYYACWPNECITTNENKNDDDKDNAKEGKKITCRCRDW